MEITGNVKLVMPAQSGVSARTGNPWMSQEYVIEIPGSYPKHMSFRILGEDRIKQFFLQQGEMNVTIQFDIDAREYNGRWFNDIRCYNVIRRGVAQTAPTPAPAPEMARTTVVSDSAPFPPAQAQDDDNLPF